MSNIYNAIQNVYNMDKTTWQEVLAELYNLVSNVENKFDIFENKFGQLLGKEVTIELKKMYNNGSLATLINGKLLKDIKTEFSEQLDTIQKQRISISNFPKIGNEIDDTNRIQRAINSLTTAGVLFFPYSNTGYKISSTITIPKSGICLLGDNAVIDMTKQNTNQNMFKIINGNNSFIKGFILKCSDAKNGYDSKIECIKIIKANNITIENIDFYNMLYSIKLDYNAETYVQNLTTNNLRSFGGAMFIHMTNLNGWNGSNLHSELDFNSTTQFDHHYYIKCNVKDVQLNNVCCKNSNGGHAIQFNRYVGGVLDAPYGDETAKVENFNVNGLLVENCGSAVMFNSECYEVSINNITAKNLNRTDNGGKGVINFFQGVYGNIMINGINARNVKCLFTVSNNTTNIIDGLSISKSTIIGGCDNTTLYGAIKNLKISDLNIDNVRDNGTTLLFSFAGQNYSNIKFDNLDLTITSTIKRTTDIIRFVTSGNYVFNNCSCRTTSENKSYTLILFSVYGGVSGVNARYNNIELENINTLYNGKYDSVFKTNCIKDNVILP